MSVAILVLGFLFVFVMQNVNVKLGNKQDAEPLSDIIHDFLPDLSKNERINKFLDYFLIVPALLILVKSPKLFVQFLFIYMVVMVIRAITINSTIMPSSDKQCKEKIDDQLKILGGCNDKIFSGHTAFVFLAALFVLKFKLIKVNPGVLIVLSVFYGVLLCMTKKHYTVDVILALVICFLLFEFAVSRKLLKK